MDEMPTFIRKDRIVVSGFSLGTEPLMVLGVMDLPFTLLSTTISYAKHRNGLS